MTLLYLVKLAFDGHATNHGGEFYTRSFSKLSFMIKQRIYMAEIASDKWYDGDGNLNICWMSIKEVIFQVVATIIWILEIKKKK